MHSGTTAGFIGIGAMAMEMRACASPSALVAHIFATNLPPWATMDDDLPRYEKLEPRR